METKFFTIPGRLQKCVKSDIISHTGQFTENTLFFIKNIGTLNFYGTYKLQNVNTHLDSYEVTRNKKYYKKEVEVLVANNLIYKLIADDTNAELIFKMYIRTADEFDLFEGANFLAMNTIYYLMSSENHQGTFKVNSDSDSKLEQMKYNAIQGPFFISPYTNIDSIKTKIAEGSIFVPYKKQKFEQIEIQKTA
jgi:hypothetical protein